MTLERATLTVNGFGSEVGPITRNHTFMVSTFACSRRISGGQRTDTADGYSQQLGPVDISTNMATSGWSPIIR